MAAAVGALVGVDIPYVITTGFVGLAAMVDELGGVDVDVPTAMSDSNSGAFFSPGVNHINGDEALAFSRNRGISGGDFTRSHNQGILILAALAKLRSGDLSPAGTFQCCRCSSATPPSTGWAWATSTASGGWPWPSTRPT